MKWVWRTPWCCCPLARKAAAFIRMQTIYHSVQTLREKKFSSRGPSFVFCIHHFSRHSFKTIIGFFSNQLRSIIAIIAILLNYQKKSFKVADHRIKFPLNKGSTKGIASHGGCNSCLLPKQANFESSRWLGEKFWKRIVAVAGWFVKYWPDFDLSLLKYSICFIFFLLSF